METAIKFDGLSAHVWHSLIKIGTLELTCKLTTETGWKIPLRIAMIGLTENARQEIDTRENDGQSDIEGWKLTDN